MGVGIGRQVAIPLRVFCLPKGRGNDDDIVTVGDVKQWCDEVLAGLAAPVFE
ncbi:Uncharacterised protein [Mycobacterium tuberculosis]|nr:Uncharacterised protein [Mycobacterium tuberculosis]